MKYIHDQLLRDIFCLQVQSEESGGSVRGVCGAEETTKVAYVPLGIGGMSRVLRVQAVPGKHATFVACIPSN